MPKKKRIPMKGTTPAKPYVPRRQSNMAWGKEVSQKAQKKTTSAKGKLGRGARLGAFSKKK